MIFMTKTIMDFQVILKVFISTFGIDFYCLLLGVRLKINFQNQVSVFFYQNVTSILFIDLMLEILEKFNSWISKVKWRF